MIPVIDTADQPTTSSGPTSFPSDMPTDATPATTAAVAPSGSPAQQATSPGGTPAQQSGNPPPGAGSVQQNTGTSAKKQLVIPQPAFQPGDYTDLGQATVLSRAYAYALRYNPGTGWMVFGGSYYEESACKAQRIAQTLTDIQFKDAQRVQAECQTELEKTGIWDKIVASKASHSPMPDLDDDEKIVYDLYIEMDYFKKFILHARSSRSISAALREAQALLYIDSDAFDADPFLLNTPNYTVDLRTGQLLAHDYRYYLTKQTAVDPSDIGKDIFDAALDTFFCGDMELVSYVQEIAGIALIGAVFEEFLVIAYGVGRNGKSTFFNALASVLGDYAGGLSAENLTTGKNNAQPEMAEMRGKRLVIASELEEGTRLNTARVKQLCSTDKILAAKKYHQPIQFTPTHTLVLYTNHLPRVGGLDDGIWRRIKVVPFNAKIEGGNDIKNYANYLVQNAGGAILAWAIEGARRVIANGFHLSVPPVVQAAVADYRENQDWLADFLDECCVLDDSALEASGDVYRTYREYCAAMGEYTRSTKDFYAAIDNAGFERTRDHSGRKIKGFLLKKNIPAINAYGQSVGGPVGTP